MLGPLADADGEEYESHRDLRGIIPRAFDYLFAQVLRTCRWGHVGLTSQCRSQISRIETKPGNAIKYVCKTSFLEVRCLCARACVCVAYVMQIYNERIFDLLDTGGEQGAPPLGVLHGS